MWEVYIRLADLPYAQCGLRRNQSEGNILQEQALWASEAVDLIEDAKKVEARGSLFGFYVKYAREHFKRFEKHFEEHSDPERRASLRKSLKQLKTTLVNERIQNVLNVPTSEPHRESLFKECSKILLQRYGTNMIRDESVKLGIPIESTFGDSP